MQFKVRDGLAKNGIRPMFAALRPQLQQLVEKSVVAARLGAVRVPSGVSAVQAIQSTPCSRTDSAPTVDVGANPSPLAFLRSPFVEQRRVQKILHDFLRRKARSAISTHLHERARRLLPRARALCCRSNLETPLPHCGQLLANLLIQDSYAADIVGALKFFAAVGPCGVVGVREAWDAPAPIKKRGLDDAGLRGLVPSLHIEETQASS
mmetsp:Transcript_67298/g.187795  ORF Transcript_67298/g.187795 Transcript_67298/m.187795 type:complete len:208 (-) Transcript_67298:442-1065(-)